MIRTPVVRRFPRSHVLLPFTLSILTSGSHLARAQEMVRDSAGTQRVIITAQSPEEELPVLESSTATRIPGERILDTPRSVSVINQRTLQDQLITDPQDAVRNVPGVQRTASFTGVGENYQLRGFLQLDILKDGFRAGQISNAGINATGPTDIANIERIEILRGPTAILYGRGEPGGLVNYVTKVPFFANQFTLEQQVGSYDFYRTQLDANWQAVPGKVAVRLDAAYDRNESFVDFVKGERYFVAPSALWQIGRDTLLTLRGEYSHDHRSSNVGLPLVNGKFIPNVPYSRYFGEPGFTDITTEEFRGLVSLEHRWNDDNRSTLSVHGRHAEGEGPYFILFSFAGPTFDPVTGNITRNVAITNTSDDNLTVRLDHVWDWTIYERPAGPGPVAGKEQDGKAAATTPRPNFAIKNQLLLAAEYERQEDNPLRILGGQAPLNVFDPQYTGYSPLPLLPFPDFPLRFNEQSHIAADAYSFLLQDRISFGETVYLSFGGRVEYFEANQSFIYPATVPFPSSSTEQDPVTFNPSAGLVVKPARWLSLYGSYAESTNSFINLGRATAGGGALDPERARQFELGAKAELLDRRLLVSTAVFQINKTDVAGTDPANPLFSINAGDERSRGFEFEVTGEPLPGWRLSLAYTYVDAKITSDPLGINVGNRRYGVPENSGSVFTTYEFPAGPMKGFGFGGGVFLADRVQIDNANSGQLSGYAQTDLVAFYRRKNYRAQVNLKNAFDNEFYFTSGDGAAVQPAPARALVGSVSVSF